MATKLPVVFYAEENGAEPVRSWLKSLAKEDRLVIGADIADVQYSWPVGMPLCRKVRGEIWEVRSRLENRIARVLFAFDSNTIVLLHGFVKKTQTTPEVEIKLAQSRWSKYGRRR